MQDPQRLIEQLEGYNSFLVALRRVDPETWNRPIAAGKWSIHEIVAHIMMWDRNFVEKTLPRLLKGQPVALNEDKDYQAFNEKAAAYGRTLTQDQLVAEAIQFRSELTDQIRKLPNHAFDAKVEDGDPMTLKGFLEQMFISHDMHHRKQIEAYLEGSHSLSRRSIETCPL